MRFLGLFLLLSVVLAAAGYYVHQRASGTFDLGARARKLLGAAIFLGMLSAIVGRVMPASLGAGVVEQVSVTGWMVALAVLVSAVLLLAIDGAHGVGWIARLGLKRARASAPSETPPQGADGPVDTAERIPRRTFIGRAAAGGALFIGSSSSFYGAFFGRHDYQLEEVEVPVRGLSRALDGFTVVQLSDIHFGTFVGEPELRAAVALVRRARPDLVVITGDMLDHDVRFAPLLGRLVRALAPLARYGVTVVAGNHDYYAGVDEVLATTRAAGATVLRNSARVVGDRGGAFALVGVDDLWARRLADGRGPDLGRALAMAPPGLPRVLLCHNPAFFPEASADVALQLSGHTHGGQVNVGVRLADFVLPYGYVAGIYERDGARLWVNRGFGTAGPPSRVGAPPEVTRIRLVAA